MPLKTGRGWLLYASAWLSYGASYFFIFRLARSPAESASLDAAINVLPAALLGIAVFWLASRLPLPGRRLPVVIAAHLAGAAVYAGLWWLAVETLLAAKVLAYTGVWHFYLWGIYAAQWQAFSGLMVYGTLTGFAYMSQAQEQVRVEERRRMEADALRIRSDLSALRSQLNPHFLFNTLHSVTALVETEPKKAEAALLSLSAMLRYALGTHDDPHADEVQFAEELRFTEAYLALESLRLGDRLRVEMTIAPEALRLGMPSLTLQPLVENAIKHSISKRPGGGQLRIRAHENEGALLVEVSDDGEGAQLVELEQSRGLGLKTVRRRLDLFYNQVGSMTIRTAPHAGLTVTLRLPQDEDVLQGA